MSNLASFNLDLNQDLYVVIIVILDTNSEHKLVEEPKSLLKVNPTDI